MWVLPTADSFPRAPIWYGVVAVSLIIEAIMAFVLGLVVFLFLPLYTFGRYSDWFIEMALAAVQRGILVKRLNAGYALKASRYNADDGTEQISMSGQTYDLEDPHNYMSRLKNRPFGIVHEKRNTIVSPRIADLGRRVAKHRRDGTLFDEWGRIRKYFSFSPERALVDMDAALNAIQGSAPPQRSEIIREYTKKGQADFNTSRYATYTIWFIMFAVGAGAPWILFKLSESMGDTSINAPIPGTILAPAIDLVVIGL